MIQAHYERANKNLKIRETLSSLSIAILSIVRSKLETIFSRKLRTKDALLNDRRKLRYMESAIEVKKRIQNKVKKIPLVSAINNLALDILSTAKNPLRLANSLTADEHVISTPIPADRPNMRIVKGDSSVAVILAGAYGLSSMVLLNTSDFSGSVVPAKVIQIDFDGVRLYSTEYTLNKKHSIFVQMPDRRPFEERGAYIPYDSNIPLNRALNKFLGNRGYKTALSLTKQK